MDVYLLVKSLCDRPETYTGERRFPSVAAWVNGFHSGLPGGSEAAEVLSGFTEWLHRRLHCPRNYAWMACVRMAHPDDEEAIRQLPVLLEEYIGIRGHDRPRRQTVKPEVDSE